MSLSDILESVAKHKCLYDIMSPDYSKLHVKDRIWQEIAQELHLGVEEVKKQFKHARDTYRRKKKEQSAPSGSAARPVKPWQHFQFCSTLFEKTNFERSTRSNYVRIEPQYLPSREIPVPSTSNNSETRNDSSTPVARNQIFLKPATYMNGKFIVQNDKNVVLAKTNMSMKMNTQACSTTSTVKSPSPVKGYLDFFNKENINSVSSLIADANLPTTQINRQDSPLIPESSSTTTPSINIQSSTSKRNASTNQLQPLKHTLPKPRGNKRTAEIDQMDPVATLLTTLTNKINSHDDIDPFYVWVNNKAKQMSPKKERKLQDIIYETINKINDKNL